MSRDGENLKVLMVSLATGLLTNPLGDDLERHVAYARRVAHLHIVVYTPRRLGAEPLRPDDHLTLYPSASFSRYAFVWDAYRIGSRLYRAEGIHVVSTQDPFTTGLVGVWLKRRFGIPLHVDNHSTYFGNRYWLAESPLRHRVFEWLGRRVVPRADTLRVSNPDQRERAIQMGLAPERIDIIHIPVRLEHFAAPADAAQVEALRERLEIPPGGKVVLWVGRPIPTKRVPDLLDAFALLRRECPEAYLLLVGDLGGAPGLSERIESLGIGNWVRRPGVVKHANLPPYYALSDVFALSSVYEGLPRVVVEAMASGLPVIATRIPAVQGAVLDGETGLLCSPEDPADMARKLNLLLSDPARAREMGQQGRATVRERFDYERMMDDIVKLWVRTAAMRERID